MFGVDNTNGVLIDIVANDDLTDKWTSSINNTYTWTLDRVAIAIEPKMSLRCDYAHSLTQSVNMYRVPFPKQVKLATTYRLRSYWVKVC